MNLHTHAQWCNKAKTRQTPITDNSGIVFTIYFNDRLMHEYFAS